MQTSKSLGKKIDFQKAEIEKKSKGLINALKGHKFEVEEKVKINWQLKLVNEKIKLQKSKNNKCLN